MNNSQVQSRPAWTQSKSPILLLGNAHSGKSELAIQCLRPDLPALVIGTAPPTEPAFQSRIAELQGLRPATWDCIYAGTDLALAVSSATADVKQVLIDSVNQWLATLLLGYSDDADGSEHGRTGMLNSRIDELITVLRSRADTRFVIVTAEVGGGPAPSRMAERLFRQHLGLANQRLARVAASVLAVQAGIPTILK
ncbi:MAG: hypothetical protein FJ146_11310 [Deltaproteobacteria bacterium]|nr:hypothetical protein [Deltaproteobacteria bacterium]